MTVPSALSEAKSTCTGLHKLIQRISEAAVDIEKGGSSSYEMHALIASANTCVINLSTQLAILESVNSEETNILPIKRQSNTNQSFDEKIKVAK